MTKSLSWSSRCSTADETATPGLAPHEILLQNKAVGIADLDFELQYMHERRLPCASNGLPILGQSNAGIVVEVGAAVTRFHKGQRVMVHCHALKTRNPKHAGFRAHTVCLESMTTLIPDSLTYATAAALPLSISTAAAALYEKTHLNITLPSQKRLCSQDSLLIIDGSSFVGTAAVQLAVASGVRVVAVAAVEDHYLIRQLGADITIDFRAHDICERMTAVLEGTRLVGVFDTASTYESSQIVCGLLQRLDIRSRVCCLRPLPPGTAEYHYTVAMGISLLRPLHAPVRDEVWGVHIPEALKRGTFGGFPSPKVGGKGLEALPAAVRQIGRCSSSKEAVVVIL